MAPKSYLPNYREFYERRHFAPGDDRRGGTIVVGGVPVPFGPDLLFRARDVPGLVLHVEVCEDMWVPVPPSAEAALAGATVLAEPVRAARSRWRARRTAGCSSVPRRHAASRRTSTPRPGRASRARTCRGTGRRWSTRWASCSPRPSGSPTGARRAVADVDLLRIRQERLRQGTFDDNRRAWEDRVGPGTFRTVELPFRPPAGDIGLRRRVDRFPFVPDDAERLALDCYEAYNIQVSGLEQRLRAIGDPQLVIGVSGGLDSTHALIVAAKAMDRLGRPRSDILAFTMPGFATSPATKDSATRLSQALGVTFEELDIRPAARQMLADMGHPFSSGEPVYDVTFENVQAGLRTDYLFRLANQRGGIVLGTGDLSELALGWCTYGVGDQMSHYAVNSGVPKTLIQHLIRWVIGTGQFDEDTNRVLEVILGQEISPELVPVGEGERPQSTEDSIGPYALQDFTLFHVLRFGFPPSRIAFLAEHAWCDPDRGEWPPGFDAATAYVVRPRDDPALAGGVRAAVLRVQPVQALGAAERAEGGRRWVAVPARRLAGPLGRQRPGVARRAPPQRPRPLRRRVLRSPTGRGVAFCGPRPVEASRSARRRRRTRRLGGRWAAGRDASAVAGPQDGTPRRLLGRRTGRLGGCWAAGRDASAVAGPGAGAVHRRETCDSQTGPRPA